MDWDTYYEKFYEWSTGTQISRMSSLTSFGTSSEVAEVAQEYMDEKAASRLVKKAVSSGVQFTPEEIYDLSGCCDTSTMNVLLKSAKCSFTQEQLEDFWGAADDEIIELVARRNDVTLFSNGALKEADAENEAFHDEPEQDSPKLGLFSKLGFGTWDSGCSEQEQSTTPRTLHRKLRKLPAPLWVSLWQMVLWS